MLKVIVCLPAWRLDVLIASRNESGPELAVLRTSIVPAAIACRRRDSSLQHSQPGHQADRGEHASTCAAHGRASHAPRTAPIVEARST